MLFHFTIIATEKMQTLKSVSHLKITFRVKNNHFQIKKKKSLSDLNNQIKAI